MNEEMAAMGVYMSRKQAFRLAWDIFKLATGTCRLGIIINSKDRALVLVGSDLIDEYDLESVVTLL